jgi:carboxylesterase
MAPEQWNRPREVDARADVFAWGLTVYRMLAGELPYTWSDVMAGRNVEAPDLRARRVDVPVALVDLLERAIALEPGDRPRDAGVLVIHGFTGNPSSMRELAESFAAAGYHVELPRLAGHGTAVADMIPTRWADWSADAEAALSTLRSRCTAVVVAGLSMGGALTLWLASRHDDIAGIICINPATQPLVDEMMQAIAGMVEGGVESFPGIGSDIADQNVVESSYSETPVRALYSMFHDGVTPLSTRYPLIHMPLQLFSSVQDHVVDPKQGDFLAETYGGPVERVMLERSFHVATQDFDKHLINDGAVRFADRVTSR